MDNLIEDYLNNYRYALNLYFLFAYLSYSLVVIFLIIIQFAPNVIDEIYFKFS